MSGGDWVMMLPSVNAGLNGLASVLLVAGGLAIKNGKEEQHKLLMMSAFVVSAVFLVFYLIYHAQVGHVVYEGTGLSRVIYLVLLIPHIILAGVQVPLILITMYHAIQDNREKHRKFARWTLPIWLYVSVTGVLVYLMVFHLDPN